MYDTLDVLNALGIVKKERNLVKFKRDGPLKLSKTENLIHDRDSREKKQKQERLSKI